MRRILSIFIALVLGLGPAISSIPTSALTAGWGAAENESRLPACCRKNGMHHCSMPTQASSSTGETTVSAQSCCPYWPGNVVSTTVSIAALVESAQSGPSTAVERHAPLSKQNVLDRNGRHTWPKRGPPALERM